MGPGNQRWLGPPTRTNNLCAYPCKQLNSAVALGTQSHGLQQRQTRASLAAMARLASLYRTISLVRGEPLSSSGPVCTWQRLSGVPTQECAAVGRLPQTRLDGLERGRGYPHRAVQPCSDALLGHAFALPIIAGVRLAPAGGNVPVGGPTSALGQRPLHFCIGSRNFSSASSRSVKNSFFIRNHVGFVSVPHQTAYVVER